MLPEKIWATLAFTINTPPSQSHTDVSAYRGNIFFYLHIASLSYPCGKPIAPGLIVGNFESMIFRSATNVFFWSILFSQ